MQTGDVLEQPLADKLQEIESELGVLEIELLDLFVADRKQLTIFDAFERKSPLVIRRNQADFADDLTGTDVLLDLMKPVAPRNRIEHGRREIAFAEEDFTGFAGALAHERL